MSRLYQIHRTYPALQDGDRLVAPVALNDLKRVLAAVVPSIDREGK